MARRTCGRRRVGRRLAAPLACALLLLTPAAFPSTSAAFTAVTSGIGNVVTAADIAPPTGLGVTQTCSSVPAPALRASSTATGVTTLTIPIPSGTVAGDVMVAQVMNRNIGTLSTPAGWTLVRRDTSGTEVQVALFWKVATASESAPTFTLSMSMQLAGGSPATAGPTPPTPSTPMTPPPASVPPRRRRP